MKKFLPAIILTISLLPGMAFADTHAAADCAQATVAAAVAAATAGDTVTIPACAATTWDDPVTIDKNLTISGDSPTTTTLRTNDEASVAADGIFIIADNVVAYIKNIGFTTTVPVDTNAFNAPIWFNGDSHTGSVIYNCKFDGHKWAIFGWDLSGVVISKNAFIDGGIQLYGPAAASWSAALGLGGDDWTFIEGNTFTVQRAQAVHIVLGYSGAKYVVRYNTISSVDGTYFIADAVDAHGYGHASGGTYGRSTRGWDVYNNLFEKKGSESRGIFLRGGSGTAHHNVFNEITGGAYDKSEIRIQDERLRVTTMNSGPQDGTSATCGTPTAGVNLSCQASEGDPCCDMIGRGANQTSDPAYFWSNYKCTSAPCLSNLTAITPTVEDGGSGYIGLGTDYYNSEKSGYTQKACVHPSVTDLSGKSCDTTLYGTSGYGIDSAHDVTPSATNCTISPAAVQTITSGNTTTFTMTAPYGYDASGSGTCGGTLSSGTYTTSAITANCTVTCTGQPHRAVLGGTGTVSLGGSGVACLSDLIALSYNGNESTSGTVPNTSRYCAGQTVTVLGNTGTLARTGYDFDGWNTAADGSGTSYSATDTFAISVATTLYAKWAVHVFSPSDISGLLAWYAADEIDGLNDGDPVGTWSDLSGNGHHFSQSTAGYKPLYKTNQVNGLPALHFDGNDGPTYNDDRMTTVDVVSPIRTVIVVARYYREASANFASYSGLITGTTADCWFIGNSGTDDWYTFESTGLTWYKDGSESNTEVTNAWHIFAATANSNRTFTVMLGYDRNNSGRTWGGEVAEIIIYNSVISGDNFTNIHNYLKTKYGTP